MKTTRILCTTLAIGVWAVFTPGCKTSQARLAAQAKVSQADAEKTALAKAPGGTVKEAELEKEHGKLIWSFEITTPGTNEITEVNIDAITGDLIGVEKEAPTKKKSSKPKSAPKQ